MENQDEMLIHVLSTIFGQEIASASYQSKSLHGGTLGDVRLISGTARAKTQQEYPYQVVRKTQAKWERPGDPASWRREYDLYHSPLMSVFGKSLRPPRLYASALHENRIDLWMEYIDGPTGSLLTIDMLEQAARELARFQAKIAKDDKLISKIACLGDKDFLKREFQQWHSQSFSRDFLISKDSRLPDFLKDQLLSGRLRLIEGKSFEYSYLRSDDGNIPQHLKDMIMDVDERAPLIFEHFEKLPTVLCHRDFWIENIFNQDGEIRLIDWDTAGRGFAGEDIISLVVDEVPADQIKENIRRLVPAYLNEFSHEAI